MTGGSASSSAISVFLIVMAWSTVLPLTHSVTSDDEAIAEPQAGVEYPRVVARNKPQYRDCERCQQQGRQTRATWICHHCSGEQNRVVPLCKECLFTEHEDHYADEIVY